MSTPSSVPLAELTPPLDSQLLATLRLHGFTHTHDLHAELASSPTATDELALDLGIASDALHQLALTIEESLGVNGRRIDIPPPPSQTRSAAELLLHHGGMQRREPLPLSTGVHALDELFSSLHGPTVSQSPAKGRERPKRHSIPRGARVEILGPPGSGKTAFVAQMAVHARFDALLELYGAGESVESRFEAGNLPDSPRLLPEEAPGSSNSVHGTKVQQSRDSKLQRLAETLAAEGEDEADQVMMIGEYLALYIARQGGLRQGMPQGWTDGHE